MPLEIPLEGVGTCLREMGFSIDHIVRMSRNGSKVVMPLILVKLTRDQAHIYNIKELVGLDVSVEALSLDPVWGSASDVKVCGEEHVARECPHPKTDPPTCANCHAEHPANYRGCARFPRQSPCVFPARGECVGLEATNSQDY
ncbi:zinc finger associated protein [Popillia japonica]|uniref:Zinc finger associated protein n=1 Tax=Popillia japonica TaxID=7064 RepID=A0AAW1KCB4_POPJA